MHRMTVRWEWLEPYSSHFCGDLWLVGQGSSYSLISAWIRLLSPAMGELSTKTVLAALYTAAYG